METETMKAASNEAMPKIARLALTRTETAEALGISPVGLWRLEKLGRIRAADTGLRRTKLFAVSEIQRFLTGG